MYIINLSFSLLLAINIFLHRYGFIFPPLSFFLPPFIPQIIDQHYYLSRFFAEVTLYRKKDAVTICNAMPVFYKPHP